MRLSRYLLILIFPTLIGSNCTPTRPTPPFDLKAQRIEVTQAIQDMDNNVLLIAGKRTFVRVYVTREKISYINPPSVTASLEGFRNGTSLGVIPPANTNGQITITGEWLRSNLDEAFYFELPVSWIQAGEITLKATIDPFNEYHEIDLSNNIITSPPLTFKPSKPLKLSLIHYSYLRDGVRIEPNSFDMDVIISYLRRMFPISNLDYKLRQISEYCGSDTNPPCNNTYSNEDHLPYALHVRQLLIGLRQTYESSDTSSLYFGLYALPRGFSFDAPGSAWFQDKVAVARTIAGGETIIDDSHRNIGILGTHEIAHLLGQNHILCTGNEENTTNEQFPNIGGPYNQFYGFDGGDPGLNPLFKLRILPHDWFDVMTYCNKVWIKDTTYTSTYGYIQHYIDSPIRKFITSNRPYESNIASGEDYIAIYGYIDVAKQTVSFSFLSKYKISKETIQREPGAYHILLFDAQEKLLANYPFSPLNDRNNDGTRLAIRENVPFILGTRRLAIYSDITDSEISSIIISTNPPQVQQLSLVINKELLPKETATLTWKGQDLDDDVLTYTLMFSSDNRSSWRVLATGIVDNTITIDMAQLEGTKSGYFRLIANDGVNTGFADSISFAIEDKPPYTRISNPASQSNYIYGQIVTLEGYGQDIEDGTLDNSNLSWTSDRDGFLGTGHLMHASSLSTGLHTITLTATDSNKQSTDSKVIINITPR